MYIGQPSLGVGIELAKLKMMNIPTICYYFEGEKVSDYTLGFLSTGKNFKIIKDITSYTWLFSYMVGVDWLKENSHGGVFHNERQKHIKKGR